MLQADDLAGGGEVSLIPAPLFSLERTLESGQVFHWRKATGGDSEQGYTGLIEETPVSVVQRGEQLQVTRGTEALVARYFALDHPLEEIYESFPADPAMDAALACCRGLRLIRQPSWECLATFITSSMKQVAHIRQMSHAVRERFGRPVSAGKETTLFAYPEPARLAQAREEELRKCGLGFRAKSLLATARMVAAGNLDLEALRSLSDAAALAELCRLPGVGPKIANCVLLFGYERVRAFPIDVWIERVLRQRYFSGNKAVTSRQLKEFSATHFGPHGGYAQQYLFHHARNQPRSAWA
jgi:N-glycosylase/DNA lyase